jgi:flagellar motor switch/type III secretory pathway protein FliN
MHFLINWGLPFFAINLNQILETTAAPGQTATIPADNLIPAELTTQASEPSSIPSSEQATTIEEEGVTSPLPPAQTSVIIGEPVAETTQASASTESPTIPEAETLESTIQSELLTTEEPIGTTAELEQVSVFNINFLKELAKHFLNVDYFFRQRRR